MENKNKTIEALESIKDTWKKGKAAKVVIIILGMLFWPITLLILCASLYYRFDKLLIKWSVIGLLLLSTLPITAGWFKGIISSTIFPSKEKNLVKNVATPTPSQGNCVGPDGKKLWLNNEDCKKFNDAWRNPQQEQKSQQASPTTTPTTVPTPSSTSTPTPKPKPVSKVIPTPVPVVATPAPAPQTDNQNISPVSSETISQKNAVRAAQSYLNYTAFSHDGLVAQLEYDQFSHADAVYGADNSGANWNEQAAKAAKQYMSYSAFSRGSLIAQLEYDKFTQAQAEYGANAVGL